MIVRAIADTSRPAGAGRPDEYVLIPNVLGDAKVFAHVALDDGI